MTKSPSPLDTPTPPRILKQWERKRVRTHNDDCSSTKQNFGPECDINNIMARFERTGLIEHVREHQGNYGDFTDLPTDYHAAQNQILAAQAMFQTMPAKIREKFDNDPGTFLAFAEDPANQSAMRDLGLFPSSYAEPLKTPFASPTQPTAPQDGSGIPAPQPTPPTALPTPS